MYRALLPVCGLLMLASCATPQARHGAWIECARTHAIGAMETGIPSSWPTATSIPDGIEVEVMSLGPHPPEAVYDALYRTLHLVPASNAFYLEQTGGIAGMRHLYGPMSLAGRCAAPAAAGR